MEFEKKAREVVLDVCGTSPVPYLAAAIERALREADEAAFKRGQEAGRNITGPRTIYVSNDPNSQPRPAMVSEETYRKMFP